MRVGIDLVQVAEIERSLAEFGPRFAARLFAAGELADSTVDGRLDAGALAQRFAAKEATIKAFDLGDAGIGWTQIEVVRDEPVRDELVRDGGRLARVRLHGRAAESAACCGAYEIAASLSRDGDLACAIVVARRS
jgi:holo-[acyl-carrier protein] synthase